MERKIGEIFTYDGKTYLIVPREKEDCCIGCAFDLGKYACKKPRNESRNNFGHCYFRFRKDKKGIIFKEINNMEIKNNQLTIDIPEGMEIDLKNSDLAKGIVKFKKKYITYENVEDTLKLGKNCKSIIINESNASKLVALSKLMNIAKYYNRDWKPSWISSGQLKYYIYYSNENNKYQIGANTRCDYGAIYFRLRDYIQAVIDNPNFRDILDAIYKN